jgi:hypothetical protein
MTKTIEQIEAENAKRGIRLVTDPKTLAAGADAHALGRHEGSATLFAPMCVECFIQIGSL